MCSTVMLSSVCTNAETTLLVRLSHQFGIGEDATLSQPATVDLAAILSTFSISSVTGKQLSSDRRALSELVGVNAVSLACCPLVSPCSTTLFLDPEMSLTANQLASSVHRLVWNSVRDLVLEQGGM